MGKIEVLDQGDIKVTITLDGNNAKILAGNNGTDGFITLMDKNGEKIIDMGHYETFSGGSSPDEPTTVEKFTGIRITPPGGTESITLSSDKNNGSKITLSDSSVQHTIRLDGEDAILQIGTNTKPGKLLLKDKQGREVFSFNSSNAALYIGANGNEGDIIVRDGNGKDAIRLDGDHAALYLGGDGTEGDVVIFPTTAKTLKDTKQASIHMNGSNGSIALGANKIFNTDDIAHSIFLNGKKATLNIGYSGTKDFGKGVGGKISIFPSLQEDEQVQAQPTITLDGNSGDIFLNNADCAEEFDISDSTLSEPGTVMVIDSNEKLKASYKEYDKRVAGVISGAGNYMAGLVLDKKYERSNRKPLAIMGKAFCKVEATRSPIEVGDLLTTSLTPGHAMKATNCSKSFGAVIGKALKAIKSGKGLIPILIALQ